MCPFFLPYKRHLCFAAIISHKFVNAISQKPNLKQYKIFIEGLLRQKKESNEHA